MRASPLAGHEPIDLERAREAGRTLLVIDGLLAATDLQQHLSLESRNTPQDAGWGSHPSSFGKSDQAGHALSQLTGVSDPQLGSGFWRRSVRKRPKAEPAA